MAVEEIATKYAIVASCDPYNASRGRYHNEKVLGWHASTFSVVSLPMT